ncbi:MAG: flagellin [Lachnospiraceae bacterium]|nr:flagellin [Lachnospiraceae bacterium]
MAMVVQHNLTAMNANRQLGITTSAQSKSSEKLSSGYRINRAADDAAGLKISEKMRSQIRGLNKASSNAQDGVSVLQTAEGALNETHSILQRMNELAVQGANDTNQSIDRDAINQELNALVEEIDRISSTTQFNKQNLLDGNFVGKNLQVGANQNQKITVNIAEMNAKAIGLKEFTMPKTSGYYATNEVLKSSKTKFADSATIRGLVSTAAACNATITKVGTSSNNKAIFETITGFRTESSAVVRGSAAAVAKCAAQIFVVKSIDSKKISRPNVSSYQDAQGTITMVQNAINNVSSQRSALGALQNRLEHTIANLDNVSENTQSAESRIRDTDMASEMVTYSKNNILAQAGQSMLAQANQSSQGVLSLLQ